MSKTNVLQTKPVYTVVTTATVTLRAAKPKKVMTILGFIFLGGIGSIAWIIAGRDFVGRLRKKE